MTAGKACSLILLLVLCAPVFAQEEAATVAETQVKPEARKIRLQELEGLAITALRQQFPRPSGIMATTSSCRLPDYGPLVNISLQLPPIYFTGPVLKELEKRSREAELRANRYREQLDRTAQVVRMKAREAELLTELESEQSRKKTKATVVALQTELDGVRKNIADLESGAPLPAFDSNPMEMHELDLEKMMTDNYQDAIRRIGAAMSGVLVERAVELEDLDSTERICIATHIRDNFLSGQERSILFILNPEDIEDFRSGRIDRDALRQKVMVKDEIKE